uniref:Putative secreted protein n=1 Tax=Ixodes scapularis TaxID=6945 RepID=A0A4D5RVA1_IXOSC
MMLSAKLELCFVEWLTCVACLNSGTLQLCHTRCSGNEVHFTSNILLSGMGLREWWHSPSILSTVAARAEAASTPSFASTTRKKGRAPHSGVSSTAGPFTMPSPRDTPP